MSRKLRLYIATLGRNYPPITLLAAARGGKPAQTLFQGVDSTSFKDLFIPTDSPAEAHYILAPYDYRHIEKDIGYRTELEKLSREHQKKIIVFWYGDYDKEITIKDALVLRTSAYRYKKRTNEIIIPPFIEDLGHAGISIRDKQERPAIGFVGWSGFKSPYRWAIYFLKNFLIDLKKSITGNAALEAHKQGIYFRKKALAVFEKSPLVKTNFVVRKSYSAHSNSIELSPEVARREYIENIISSDFTIAVRGDGNYSLRFYETLSLGRLPIFIDTECVLPFEEEISYDEFILKVPHTDIGTLPETVSSFYQKLSPTAFTEMQNKARHAFEAWLNPPRFYALLFEKLSDAVDREMRTIHI